MQVLHDMRVMTKLMLAAGLTCAIVIAVGLVGVAEVADMRDVADTMYEHEVLGVAAAQAIDIGVLKVLDAGERALAHPEQVAAMRAEVAVQKRAIETALARLETSNGGAEPEAEEREVRTKVPLFLQFAETLLAKLEAGDMEGARAEEAELTRYEQSLDALTRTLADRRLDRAKAEDVRAGAIHAESKRFMYLFMAGAVLLGFGAAFVVARSISNPLRRSVAVLQDVAAGDLTASLDLARRDELGVMADALNRAVESMRAALTEVRTSAFNVAGTAGQLQAAAQDISSGAQEQASGLEEAAASLEEMAEAIRQNADGAQRASEVSLASRETAEQGGRIVAEAVEAMDGANVASQRIAQIIGTIDEIAFQTNLLALNAAVEAARAGEQGRGFAVVASEVRNLAQRSAGSAKEIKELIQDSVSRVENGSRLVNESGESLATIVESVKRVTDLVGEIAAASKEQSIGVDHVNTAVMQADRVTQGNAAQTEELSGSAESLAANSQQLLSLVSRFKTEDGTNAAVDTPRAEAPILSLRPGGASASASTPLAPTGTDGYEEF